jgi:hypothetical protein
MAEQTPVDSPDPIARLAERFAGPVEDTPAPEEASEQPDEGEAVEGDEAEAPTAETEEAEDGQTADEEGDAEAEEQSDDDDDKSGEPQFIEVDGENLTVEEVKLGYLRQSDYTRKTQAVAEQRKAAEEERGYFASALNSVLTAVGADVQRFESVDWERAAVENPDQYRQAKAAYEQSRQLFDGIRHQTEDFVQRTKQAQEAALKAQAKEAVAILKTAIPGWNNDLYAQIGTYAQKELGFKAEEFNNIADHRAIQSIWKAMQYDKGRQVATEKKVKVAPSKTLSNQRSAEPKVVTSKRENQQLRSRLKETGKMDDAVALLAKRMKV